MSEEDIRKDINNAFSLSRWGKSYDNESIYDLINKLVQQTRADEREKVIEETKEIIKKEFDILRSLATAILAVPIINNTEEIIFERLRDKLKTEQEANDE